MSSEAVATAEPLPAQPLPLEPSPAEPVAEVKPEIDVQVWLKQQGATAASLKALGPRSRVLSAFACVEHALEGKAANVLECGSTHHIDRGQGARSVYRVQHRHLLLTVRQRRPVVLLDVVGVVSPLNKEALDQPNILDIGFRMLPGGTRIEFGTEPSVAPLRDCAEVLPELRMDAREPGAIGMWSRFDLQLATTACNARGVYVWNGGRFARQRRVPTPPSGLSGP